VAVQRGEADTQSANQSRSVSRGLVPSASVQEGRSVTVTEQPYTAYRKRSVVTSRIFYTLEEQITMFLQRVKTQPEAHFVLKTRTGIARFVRAPHIEVPRVARLALEKARQRMFATRPYFATVQEVEAEERARQARLTKALPAAPAVYDPANVWTDAEVCIARVDPPRLAAKNRRKRR
jgi:hypothetical protein